MLAALVVAGAALPGVASGRIERIAKQDGTRITVKVAGLPGATFLFTAQTNKLLSKHGRPTTIVGWANVTLPISCAQGTVEMGGPDEQENASGDQIDAGGAFSSQIAMAQEGFAGVTVTISGKFSNHDKRVSGTITLAEDPSPGSYYVGASRTQYTDCTVSTTPYPWSAKVKWLQFEA